MSLLSWILNKVKLLFLCIINAVRKSFCCFQRRRVNEPVVLTDVVSTCSYAREKDDTNWSMDWDMDGKKKPNTVQEHIEYYRETKQKAGNPHEAEESTENDLNFFQDMTPKIIPQKKVVLQSKTRTSSNEISSRLKVSDQTFMPVIKAELTEWDDSDLMTAWEEAADCDTGRAIREKRQADREKRLAEQMRKKQEREICKTSRQPLAIKLS